MPRPVTYLSSEYPALSHTFIDREIQAIRTRDITVHTASVNRPAHLERMTDRERRESAETLYIKSVSPLSVIKTHFRLLKRAPLSYLRMTGKTLNLVRTHLRSLFKGAAYLAEAGVLLEWMEKRDSSHVHVHFANPSATVAMIASWYGTVDFSLSVHGPDVFYNVDPMALEPKFRQATFIRAISHYCRSQIQRLLPPAEWDKVHIVHCGVDPEQFGPRPDPGNEHPVILCVGRLVPAKGQHVLVRACALLAREGFRFKLVLVGDGPDRDSLARMVREYGLDDHVQLTGPLGQPEVRKWYDRADIFVLASFAEGLHVVLMEAMAKTIPSISTRITGHGELLRSGENGLLVPASDTDGLTDALRSLLTNPELRKQLGAAGRESVLAEFDLENNCAKMAELFASSNP